MRIPGPPGRLLAALTTVPPLFLFLATAAVAQQPPDYRLQAGDRIEVSVWKEPELQKLIIVRPDGKFSFPLAGEVAANGRTVAQVQKDIETKLKVYIPEPVVTVTITEIGGFRVYVIGQVVRPGAYVMNPRLNVLQALSLAGGTTPFASLNGIIVMRNSGTEQRVLPFRYEDVSKGRNLEQNVLLEAGDVIIVP